MTELELLDKAIEARKFSYSPYSHYAVGAAILMKDGKVVLGANQENAAYGDSMCAERVAIFSSRMMGYTKKDIVMIAIASDADDLPYPCGSCRQVLSELFPLDGKVICGNLKHKMEVKTLEELLPNHFILKD